MNQMERDTDAAINNMEDEEEEEDNNEDDIYLNIDTPSSQVCDARINSADEVQSYLGTSGNYSSLLDTHTTQHQPTIYSQLGSLPAVLSVVIDKDDGDNVEQREPHTYNNIQ